jgi:mono/diheme cytochrome c family protein
MTDEHRRDTDADRPRDRIDIFLDDASEPLLSTTPPLSFELDTSGMEDGPHSMRIEAYDDHGVRGVRTIDFSVRNGPGIAVSGIRQHDVLDGKIPVMVNAYGGTAAVNWEPSQAETPAPTPTWAWVLFIVVIAFGIFYGIQQWSPTGDFARTPTYGTFEGSPSPAEAAAAAAVPASAVEHAPPGSTQQGSTVPWAAQMPTDAARGAALYSVNCAACHQNTGQGLAGVFPPLAGDPVVQALDPTEHIITVLNGKQGGTIGGVNYPSPMPAFKAILNDDDLAAVVNYERTSWGNAAPTVQGADVARLRK